jgi:hypothetical protein
MKTGEQTMNAIRTTCKQPSKLNCGGGHQNKMRSSLKKVLQAITLLSLVAYMTQVLRQYNSSTSGVNSSVGDDLIGGKRGLNSLNSAAENSAFLPPSEIDALPPSPKLTQLDDIFISVKTTLGFHQKRLDAILKTWFALARD